MKVVSMLLLCLFVTLSGFQQPNPRYDICVYGETPSGIMAAIQAARMGKKVVLISTIHHLGGVMTSGLTATDMNRYRAVGGVPREVFQEIYAYYENPAAWKNQTRDQFMESTKLRSYTGKNDSLKMQWVYESHVLENIFVQMLKDAGVTVVYSELLDRKKGVIKKGNKIESITTTKGKKYSADMFIDATYEGDLMAAASVSYTVGREPNSLYNETMNGVTTEVMTGTKVTFEGLKFDPYIKEGDRSSGLLPFVEPHSSLKEPGSGDKKVQAFTYRLTLTNDPANRIPITKPKNYNPLWFEFMARRFKIKSDFELTNVITITPMPNRKTDTNHLDFVGASNEWAEADNETRKKIAQMHKDYALGKLWFLANDERVPEHIRQQMKQWGLPKDEFKDNGNFPYQIYVREARRMVSDYVMTEHNAKKTDKVVAPNSVGLGTYAFDSHGVTRVVNENDSVVNEGFLYKTNVSTYPINYLSIVPKKSECANLLVPVCMSSSHVAFASIRMEPLYMVLGQSAGTAAALSIDRKEAVQDLPYEVLRKQLLADKSILEPGN